MKHIILFLCTALALAQTMQPMNPSSTPPAAEVTIPPRKNQVSSIAIERSESSETTTSTYAKPQIPQKDQAHLYKPRETASKSLQFHTQEQDTSIDKFLAKKYPTPLSNELSQLDQTEAGIHTFIASHTQEKTPRIIGVLGPTQQNPHPLHDLARRIQREDALRNQQYERLRANIIMGYHNAVKMTSQYNNERSQHRQEQIDRHKKFITNKKTAEIFAVSFDQGKGIEPIKEKFVLAQAELTEAQREHDDYVKKIDAQGKRIDQDKALNIMTRLELAKLAVLQLEDELDLAYGCLKLNNAAIEKNKKLAIEKACKTLDQDSYEEIQNSIKKFEDQRAQRQEREITSHREIHRNEKRIDELKKKLNKLYFFQILKRSELEEKIAHHKQHLRSEYVSCKAAQVGQQQLDAAIDYGNKLLQKEALAREAAIQTNKSTLVNLQQATIATDLKQALEQTQKEQGAVSTVQYTVDQATLIALENLGINSNTGLATKFTGDHVQQYIHGQLIESLNRIGSFSQTSPQIKSLLKTAATCNITGQQLNKEHCIEGALWAKEACDRILDLGAAICEGAQEGIISAAQTTIAICQGVANVGGLVGKALGGSEIAQFKIEVAFNRACHAAAQFAQRHARHMILDSLTSGATSIAIGNSIARDLEQPAQQIYAEFLAMSPRDKAKAISKFIVENACFGLIGDAIGQVAKTGYSAVADTVRSLTAAEALFEETVNLTSQALTNEAHVLQAVTEAVQKEVTFLTNVEEVTSFVKNECSNLATGQQSAAQIIAEKSSLKIPSNMAALELLTNVHPEVITLDTLVAAIEKYHPVPGFTGHSDAVLERILGQGDAKVIAHASNTEKAIKAIRGTVFEIETAIKLEAAGEKITEFGAKYYKPGEIIRKGFDPLDFDLATANTLIECKSGNLFSVVNSPTQLEDFIESLLAHKQAAESVGKEYLLMTSKPLPEQLKKILQENAIKFIEP